ncbi:hypothetical protein ACF0H5_018731 [Mactra antiquata]
MAGSEEKVILDTNSAPTNLLADITEDHQNNYVDTLLKETRTADELSSSPRKKRDWNKGRKRIWCKVCGKLYRNKNHFEVHMRSHTGERPFVCKVCGTGFMKSSNLKEHSKRHLGIQSLSKRSHTSKPRPCSDCGKVFYSSVGLRRHKVLHDTVPKFTCDKCGKKYFHESSFRRHLKVESGVKKYACDLCSRRYVDKCDLRKHLLWHSDIRPYSCTDCGKSFVQSGSLNAHTCKKRYSQVTNEKNGLIETSNNSRQTLNFKDTESETDEYWEESDEDISAFDKPIVENELGSSRSESPMDVSPDPNLFVVKDALAYINNSAEIKTESLGDDNNDIDEWNSGKDELDRFNERNEVEDSVRSVNGKINAAKDNHNNMDNSHTVLDNNCGKSRESHSEEDIKTDVPHVETNTKTSDVVELSGNDAASCSSDTSNGDRTKLPIENDPSYSSGADVNQLENVQKIIKKEVTSEIDSDFDLKNKASDNDNSTDDLTSSISKKDYHTNTSECVKNMNISVNKNVQDDFDDEEFENINDINENVKNDSDDNEYVCMDELEIMAVEKDGSITGREELQTVSSEPSLYDDIVINVTENGIKKTLTKDCDNKNVINLPVNIWQKSNETEKVVDEKTSSAKVFNEMENIEKATNKKKSSDAEKKICRHCQISFSGRSSYIQHLKKEHFSWRGKNCNICGAKLKWRNWDKHKCEACSLCNRIFNSRKSLKNHQKKLHSCRTCNLKFCSLKQQSIHFKTSDCYEHVTCKKCNKVFKSDAKHNKHQELHDKFEQEQKNKPYQCEKCGQGYQLARNLRKHYLWHEGSKFRCRSCYKKCFDEHYLIRHEKVCLKRNKTLENENSAVDFENEAANVTEACSVYIDNDLDDNEADTKRTLDIAEKPLSNDSIVIIDDDDDDISLPDIDGKDDDDSLPDIEVDDDNEDNLPNNEENNNDNLIQPNSNIDKSNDNNCSLPDAVSNNDKDENNLVLKNDVIGNPVCDGESDDDDVLIINDEDNDKDLVNDGKKGLSEDNSTKDKNVMKIRFNFKNCINKSRIVFDSAEKSAFQTNKLSYKINRSDDWNHVKPGNSNHAKIGDSNHAKIGDSNHAKIGDSNHAKIGDSNHANIGDSNHAKIGDSNHAKMGDSNHAKMGDSNHVKPRLVNHAKTENVNQVKSLGLGPVKDLRESNVYIGISDEKDTSHSKTENIVVSKSSILESQSGVYDRVNDNPVESDSDSMTDTDSDGYEECSEGEVDAILSSVRN